MAGPGHLPALLFCVSRSSYNTGCRWPADMLVHFCSRLWGMLAMVGLPRCSHSHTSQRRTELAALLATLTWLQQEEAHSFEPPWMALSCSWRCRRAPHSDRSWNRPTGERSGHKQPL